ncbi:hypothetical protein K470DRAFT_136348 [Piedraia hortae CBS 480.64]|uniref:MFS general substrate transporter n=1 Tax=Piedraia hortae CBS 480.64 TaxID=1314780 RepID=A0A6A7BSL6_9PEZI|nr:hypothetical protein K470DRAFT_136348 [Piedraia hortae CBS 480.64]
MSSDEIKTFRRRLPWLQDRRVLSEGTAEIQPVQSQSVDVPSQPDVASNPPSEYSSSSPVNIQRHDLDGRYDDDDVSPSSRMPTFEEEGRERLEQERQPAPRVHFQDPGPSILRKSSYQPQFTTAPPRSRSFSDRRRSSAVPRVSPKRNSIDPSQERRPTLTQLPPHLEESSDEDDDDDEDDDVIELAELEHGRPRRSSSLQAQYRPSISRITPRRQSQQALSETIDDMEDLMDEAVSLARNASMQGRPDDVKDIFDSATRTVRRASSALPGEAPAPGIGVRDFADLDVHEHRGSVSIPTAEDAELRRRSKASISQPPRFPRRGTQQNEIRPDYVGEFLDDLQENHPDTMQDIKDEFRPVLTLPEDTGLDFDLGGVGKFFTSGKRRNKRQPIARLWSMSRKRLVAIVACLNTIFIGLVSGIYAGEVPKMQYQIADTEHRVILGNVMLFLGLGLSTLLFWPLPLLHGRKTYILLGFAILLPLQFPQAMVVSSFRAPRTLWRVGLLLPRIFSGIALGFININTLPTLFDLFGCSLMQTSPHEEVVDTFDIRRQGGGVGIWLGYWSWAFTGSLSLGFATGAAIISKLHSSWGFYITVILLAIGCGINVLVPETRKNSHRGSLLTYLDEKERLRRTIARGEVKLHMENTGPKYA